MTGSVRHTLFPLASAILAAVSLILTEIAIRFYRIDPLLVIVLGNLSGGLVLLLMSARSSPNRGLEWQRRNLATIVVGALCIYALAYLMAFNAIALIGAGKVALLGQLETLFVIIFAIIFLGEVLTVRRGIAGLAALAGTILINFDLQTLRFTLGWGEVLATLAPVSIATGIIILKSVLDKADALRVTGLALVVGAVFLTPIVPVMVSSFQLSLAMLAVIVLMGIFRGTSWLTYNQGLKRIGAARSAIIFISFAFFTVMFQAVIAWLAPRLGMQLPTNLLAALLGGSLIATGIIILQTDPTQVGEETPRKRWWFFI